MSARPAWTVVEEYSCDDAPERAIIILQRWPGELRYAIASTDPCVENELGGRWQLAGVQIEEGEGARRYPILHLRRGAGEVRFAVEISPDGKVPAGALRPPIGARLN